MRFFYLFLSYLLAKNRIALNVHLAWGMAHAKGSGVEFKDAIQLVSIWEFPGFTLGSQNQWPWCY